MEPRAFLVHARQVLYHLSSVPATLDLLFCQPSHISSPSYKNFLGCEVIVQMNTFTNLMSQCVKNTHWGGSTMAQRLRTLAALSENLSSVRSIRVRWLTTICNSSSGELDILFWVSHLFALHRNTYMYIIKNTYFKNRSAIFQLVWGSWEA